MIFWRLSSLPCPWSLTLLLALQPPVVFFFLQSTDITIVKPDWKNMKWKAFAFFTLKKYLNNMSNHVFFSKLDTITVVARIDCLIFTRDFTQFIFLNLKLKVDRLNRNNGSRSRFIVNNNENIYFTKNVDVFFFFWYKWGKRLCFSNKIFSSCRLAWQNKFKTPISKIIIFIMNVIFIHVPFKIFWWAIWCEVGIKLAMPRTMITSIKFSKWK